MRLIGDIHGKIIPYLDLLEGCEDSIQVGDFGMGFLTPYQESRAEEAQAGGHHRFIRGNHDDPAACKDMPGFIEDGFVDQDRDMMFIGGAWSIDHLFRTSFDAKHGTKSWWEDEELTVDELARVHALFVYHKPSIVITHDCPTQAAYEMFFTGKYHMGGPQKNTRTADALQCMFYDHKPDLWVFGHWHMSERKKIDGTEFVCLNELEYLDI